MSVYLVRHGESVANQALVLSGTFDHPLTNDGRIQAREVGHRLRGVRFAGVFTSVLVRAVETAALILEECAGHGGEWVRNARLNERDFGIYENVAQSWIAENHGRDVLHKVHTDVGFRIDRANPSGMFSSGHRAISTRPSGWRLLKETSSWFPMAT